MQKRYKKHTSNTSIGKTMILSKCEICDSKNSRLTKNQKAKRLFRP